MRYGWLGRVALPLVVAAAIALPSSGLAATLAGSVTPGIAGRPGVIQFIGSGRIDQGPFRPGYVYPGTATAAAPSRAKSSAEEARVTPSTRLSRQASPNAAFDLREALEVRVAASSPALRLSFDGLTHRDVILTPDQFFGHEPPDQGLCVGNGYVLETVNSALRVFDTRGKPLTDPIGLNAFYGYPPEFDPNSGVYSAFIFDISCYYDPDTRRWFHTAVTVDVDPDTGAIAGPNRLDLAVSNGPNPLQRWNHYAIPMQNDGSEGTPDHACYLGPCFGDFPHIGADQNGFYISTNEFGNLFGSAGPDVVFSGANIYAISKAQLATGRSQPTIVQFEQFEAPFGGLAATVWPAMSPDAQYDSRASGTAYFVSNYDCVEVGCVTDTRLAVWALVNTRSLDTQLPSPRLSSTVVEVNEYAPLTASAEQPAGDIPLAQCINDTSMETPFGTGCWRYHFPPDSEPAHDEAESPLESGTAGITQVYFADGRLWTTQGTTVVINSEEKTGIAYYILRPDPTTNTFAARVELEGQFGMANNNLIFPAVAATKKGRGIISFSLVGEDHYPSAAFVTLDGALGVGPIQVTASGHGPTDGFSGYAALGGGPEARFGDYGAAVAEGSSVWIASEYIAQTCTLEEYLISTTESPLFSCDGTRTRSANWSTRVSKISP